MKYLLILTLFFISCGGPDSPPEKERGILYFEAMSNDSLSMTFTVHAQYFPSEKDSLLSSIKRDARELSSQHNTYEVAGGNPVTAVLLSLYSGSILSVMVDVDQMKFHTYLKDAHIATFFMQTNPAIGWQETRDIKIKLWKLGSLYTSEGLQKDWDRLRKDLIINSKDLNDISYTLNQIK